MEISRIFHTSNREQWRAWLQAHHDTEKDVWLIYYRKETGRPRIPYNDAVEEALCFGWIDSTQKSYDAERLAQRFSPRRPGSAYSQTNKERMRRMIAQGKVSAQVLASLDAASLDAFVPPDDIMQALGSHPQAWQNFQRYSESYQRIRIAYIDSGRDRPGEFEKRLKHFLEKTGKNRQFGHDIESYY